MGNTLKIHEFDMCIYPRKLWVVKTKKPMQIRERFLNEHGNELSDRQDFSNLGGFVMKVIEKETNDIGYIVCLLRKADCSTICHEATHVSLLMCEDIGLEVIENSDNEHIAYLNGWIADKIWQVNNNKFKY